MRLRPTKWRNLAPGVYSDPDGTMHIDLGEMCVGAGYEPTPENLATIEKAARDTFGLQLEIVDDA